MHVVLLILLFLLWSAAGVAASFLLAGFAALASLGGMQTPPAIYWLTVMASWSIVPAFLSLGWVPTAWKLYKERPALKFGLITLGIQVFVFLATFVLLNATRSQY